MKINIFRLLSRIALVSTLFLSPAHARLIEVWSYDKFAEASDCVAILEPLENKTAKDTLPERPPRHVANDFDAINTRFRIHTLFKAKEAATNDLTVLHFAEKGVRPCGKRGSPIARFVFDWTHSC